MGRWGRDSKVDGFWGELDGAGGTGGAGAPSTICAGEILLFPVIIAWNMGCGCGCVAVGVASDPEVDGCGGGCTIDILVNVELFVSRNWRY